MVIIKSKLNILKDFGKILKICNVKLVRLRCLIVKLAQIIRSVLNANQLTWQATKQGVI